MRLTSIVPTRLLVELAAVLGIVFGMWWLNDAREEWKSKYETLHASEVANADRHNRELRAAADIKAVELDAIRRDAADPGSLEPVRLCTRPASVPAGGSPAATTGTAAAGIHEVPAGDPGLRGGEAGPDIHPLLKRLAVGANAVTAALREQQGVK